VDSEQLFKRIYEQKGEAETRVAKLEAEKAQLEAERDAAVADITRMVQEPDDPGYCNYCKMTKEECNNRDCKWRSAFVWRGIQKEATP
jgi:hypothetical protein